MWKAYRCKGISEALDKWNGSLTHMGRESKTCRQGPIGKWEHRLRHVTREPSGRGPLDVQRELSKWRGSPGGKEGARERSNRKGSPTCGKEAHDIERKP